MLKDIGTIAFRFVILILVQIFLLNHFNIGGLFNPYIYIWFILFLPYRIRPALLFLLSFLLGITIDLFSQTLGMHAFACLLTAFVRYKMLQRSTASEHDRGRFPSLKKAGGKWFFQYAFVLVVTHHLSLFWIESFCWADLPYATLRALCSAVLTLFLIYFCEFFSSQQS